MSTDGAGPRKRLRVGHVSERGAINAVRTLLERHGLVVIEVDGRGDYGRDLLVDVIEGGEGHSVAVLGEDDGRRGLIWLLGGDPNDSDGEP